MEAIRLIQTPDNAIITFAVSVALRDEPLLIEFSPLQNSPATIRAIVAGEFCNGLNRNRTDFVKDDFNVREQ